MAASSAVELEPVAKVTARLLALLERAKQVKPETTVDPPLPVADFVEEIEGLHEDFDERCDQVLRLATVEAATRDLFYALITSADINQPAFAEVWNLLDIALICGDHERCVPELVCWLLEELLDSQTTHGCRTVFDYLDSRRERLAQKDFHKKNLVFLRSCNELLRRLSRAEDAIFCGRVFFFLFQTFPLGDKSSVNLRGEFHTENTTKFEAPTTEEDDGEQMQVDPKPVEQAAKEEDIPQPTLPNKPGSRTTPITKPPSRKTPEEEVASTSDLYSIFWRLQHDFSDPTRLFDSANFATFKKGLAGTILKFKNTPTVVQTKASEDTTRAGERKHGDETVARESDDLRVDNYNPKYLTSRDLFDLELSDLAFQRHILVQALILIDFLLSLTEKAKKKLAELPTTNKSMLYGFTLSEEDTTWATSTRTAIKTYLDMTSEGRHYCRMVETVLARDKNWVRWKVENCPSMIRGPVSTDHELEARKSARAYTRSNTKKTSSSMDLSFLDGGSSGGLEALKGRSRHTAAMIDQLVRDVKVDKLDLDFAEGEEKEMLTNKIQGATWRALRQARATDLSLLDRIESTKDLEEMEEVLKRPDYEQQQQPHAEQGGEMGELAANIANGSVAVSGGVNHESLLVTSVEDQTMEEVVAK